MFPPLLEENIVSGLVRAVSASSFYYFGGFNLKIDFGDTSVLSSGQK